MAETKSAWAELGPIELTLLGVLGDALPGAKVRSALPDPQARPEEDNAGKMGFGVFEQAAQSAFGFHGRYVVDLMRHGYRLTARKALLRVLRAPEELPVPLYREELLGALTVITATAGADRPEVYAERIASGLPGCNPDDPRAAAHLVDFAVAAVTRIRQAEVAAQPVAPAA